MTSGQAPAPSTRVVAATNAPLIVSRARAWLVRLALLYWGVILVVAGLAIYFLGIAASVLRLLFALGDPWRGWNEALVWYSGVPTTIGLGLIVIDLLVVLPFKRAARRQADPIGPPVSRLTVALTAYNDEESIGDAVRDFVAHPLVQRVIVVSNSSTDRTAERAAEAGAIVHNETRQGYGWCVFRCLSEGVTFDDSSHVVLCEGDGTFRAADIDKFVAYAPHAEIVNGTRIVEQLRQFETQLTTFMYYGNFFVGKLLEAKHLGKGTFTDVGTTYKIVRRDALRRLLPMLSPSVNLEFNAHLLDTALEKGFLMVECPITFHPRVGVSKGGNVSNRRALRVGLRMLLGLSFGWRWLR
jgi:Glycosyl transferase family 2